MCDMPAISRSQTTRMTPRTTGDRAPTGEVISDKVAATSNYGSRRDRCEFVQGRAHSKIVTVYKS